MNKHATLHAPLSAALIALAFSAALFAASPAFADTPPQSQKTQDSTTSTTLTTQDSESSTTKTDTSSAAKAASNSNSSSSSTSTTTTVKTAEVTKTSIAGAKTTSSNMTLNVAKNAKPSVTVTLNGKTLKQNTDYRLRYDKDGASSYTTPTTAGTYTLYAEALDSSTYSDKVKVGTFTLYSASLSSGTAYYIFSQANTNCVLDAAGAKPGKGSNVSIWTRNGGTNQQWKFELQDDGYYIIRNVANNNLVLDAAGATPKQGANVSTWSKNSGLNQRWVVEKSGSTYIVHNAKNPNYVLDASGTNPKTGANVTVWTNKKDSSQNQKWQIKSQSDTNAELDSLAASNKSSISDGTYTIYASSLSGYPVLDVKNSSKNTGANIQTASSNASASQKWEISHDGNYVVIKNSNSGLYLSAASSKSGANVALSSNKSSRDAKWIFVKNSDGSYTIKSAAFTNISLDITGAKTKAGTNVEVYNNNGTNAQKFNVVKTQSVSTGDTSLSENYYYIKSSTNSGLQLDVTGASTANNTNIEIWTKSSNLWQLFKLQKVNGYYRIVNAYTNKALTVANNSLVPGANVVSYTTSSSADNQLWKAVKNSNGTYSFVNKKNGFALQIASSSQKAGTNVNTSWYSSSNTNQQFTMEKVTDLLPTGLYNFKSAKDSSKVLDVTSSSTKANANIEIWSNNSGLNQKWNVQKVGTNTYTLQAVCSGLYLADNGASNVVQVASATNTKSQWTVSIVNGGYVLKNVGTGKVLDVTGAKTANGTNVGTYAQNNGANQRWNISSTVPIPNGTYLIRSKAASGQVIDVAGKSTANKGNVDMWASNGGGNQKFTFTRNSDGTYTIVNCLSGKALEAASSSSGANIYQNAKSGATNQKWKAVYNNDGSFKFVSAANSKVVLGVGGTTVANGTNVCLATDSGSSYQHFTLEKTTYVSIPNLTGNSTLDKRIYDLAKSKGSLRACYDWVKNHKHTNWAGSGVKRYENGTTYWYADEVSRMLDGRATDCYSFAATFACMAKALGYDAKAVCGYVPSRSLGWAAHSWVEIKQNGTTYVYDPDLGRSYPSINFYHFTYGSAPISYKK